MLKRAAYLGCPWAFLVRHGYEAQTPASKARHAPAGTARTAPPRLVVSRTTIPGASVPTSTQSAEPLLPL